MRTLAILLVLASPLAIACTQAPQDVTSNDEIIGGVDAKSHALDAVGALVMTTKSGSTSLCTGTLIAPDLVITAKHCVVADPNATTLPRKMIVEDGKVEFRIGADLRQPSRIVLARDVYTCGLEQGGSANLGCDVAIYRLAEKVTDVTPLTVAPPAMAATFIGTHVTALGYGRQAASEDLLGTRKLGTLTVQAVSGPGLHVAFPTYEAYAASVEKLEGVDYVRTNDPMLRYVYDYALVPDYEVQVGGAPDNAQTCPGDSGGPLIAKVDGKLVIQAVDSTGSHGVKHGCQPLGAIFATLGPAAQTLREAAQNDPCADVPRAGRCEGDVAVRCSRADEGARRVTRTDCSGLLQRCVAGSPTADVSCGD